MGIKVNVGLAKKIGQPDYGSLGATCNVEFELDGGFDNGSSEHFHDAVRRAYGACRQAVEAEIEANRSATVGNRGGGQQAVPSNRVGNHANNGSGNVRNATSSQIRPYTQLPTETGSTAMVMSCYWLQRIAFRLFHIFLRSFRIPSPPSFHFFTPSIALTNKTFKSYIFIDTPLCYLAETLISSIYTSSQSLLASHTNLIFMSVGNV